MTERCKLKPGAMILHLRAHKIIPQKWFILIEWYSYLFFTAFPRYYALSEPYKCGFVKVRKFLSIL